MLCLVFMGTKTILIAFNKIKLCFLKNISGKKMKTRKFPFYIIFIHQFITFFFISHHSLFMSFCAINFKQRQFIGEEWRGYFWGEFVRCVEIKTRKLRVPQGCPGCSKFPNLGWDINKKFIKKKSEKIKNFTRALLTNWEKNT